MTSAQSRAAGCAAPAGCGAGLGSAWFQQFRPLSLDWPEKASEPRQYARAPRDRALPHLELGRASRRPARRRGDQCGAPRRGSEQAELLARRKKVTNALDIMAAGASTSASVAMAFPPPYGQIAAACGYITGAALKIAGAMRRKGDLALQGDDRAIAGWVRRMSRWSAAKRARRARQVQAQLARLEQKCRRSRARRGTRLQVALAKTRLKAAALVGVYAEARKNRRASAPLIEGDPRTAPKVTETDPTANLDTPADDVAPNPEAEGAATFDEVPGYLVAGGALAVALLLGAVFVGASAPTRASRDRARAPTDTFSPSSPDGAAARWSRAPSSARSAP